MNTGTGYPTMSMHRITAPVLFLLSLFALSGCGVGPQYDDRAQVNLAIGTPGESIAQSEPSPGAVLLAALIREAHAAALADSHPWLSYLTLELHAPGFTTAGINADYNDGAFEVVDGVIRLYQTETTIVVPNSVTVTFTVSAYTTNGYRLYRNSVALTPQQMNTAILALPISLRVDVDPALPALASDPACPSDTAIDADGNPDSDSDGLCDTYEDLFHSTAGVADIDGDSLLNSQDTDTDNDGLNDNDPNEGITPSNHGYPRFVHKNLAPTYTGASITTKTQQVSEPTTLDVTDPDLGDTHSFTIVQQPQNGSAWFGDLGELYYQGNTGFSGTDSVIVLATDQGGLSVEGIVEVQVITPTAPVAVADQYSGEEDSPITGITPLANDYSPDDLPLSLVSVPTRSSAGGSITDNQDGSYTYTPPADYYGTDSFVYTITDGVTTSEGVVTLEIVGINDAPVAVEDSFTVFLNTPLESANVLSNDSDKEGPLLVARMDSTSSAGGSVVNLGNGGFTYTPPTDYTGTDSFTYSLSDGDISVDSIVTLLVQLDSPPTVVDDEYSTDEETPLLALAVLANDSDPDGDTLTLVALDTSATPASASITADGQGIDFDPRGALDHLSTGTTQNQVLTYTVEDSAGNRSNGTVTIIVSGVNDPPTLNSGESNSASLITISGQVINTPNLVSRVTEVDLSDPLAAIANSPTPAGGVLSSNNDGTFSYTPAAGFVGTDTFTIRVVDEAVTGVDFTIAITTRPALPTGANRGWVGNVSTSWNDAANWLPSGVPANNDSLYIYAGTPYSLRVDDTTPATTLSGLQVEQSGSMLLDTPALTLAEGASVMADGAIASNTGAYLILTGFNNIHGTVPKLLANGPVAFQAATTITGNLELAESLAADSNFFGAPTTIIGDLNCASVTPVNLLIESQVSLTGGLSLSDACSLNMNASTAQLVVNGDTLLNGGVQHQLQSGELMLAGNLTLDAATSLSTTALHNTHFFGSTVQQIQLGAPQNQPLGNLFVVNNTGLHFTGDLTALGSLTIPSPVNPTLSASGARLSVADVAIDGATFDGLTLTTSGLTQLDNFTSQNVPTDSDQLVVTLSGGSAVLNNPRFLTLPVTGNYIRGDGPAVVTLNGALPGYGLTKSTTLNGFILNWGTGTEDSDNDTYTDAEELAAGTDPLDLNSHPGSTVISAANGNNEVIGNVVWGLSGSPYLVQDSVTITSGATLTIEAGVVVKFNNPVSMNVISGGNLLVNGLVEQPVTFTSMHDDSIGGDSDGITVTPLAGDWGRLSFASGSTGTVNALQLRYADSGVQISGTSPTLNRVSVLNSNYGMRILSAPGVTTAPIISDLLVDSSLYYGLEITSTGDPVSPSFTGSSSLLNMPSNLAAIYVNGSAANPSITGFTVQGGNFSLFLQGGASGSYTNSTLSGATTAALHLENGSAPTVDASLLLEATPFAVHLFNQVLPAGVSTATRFNIGYPDVVRIAGALQGAQTLAADPLGTGSSVWHVDNTFTVADDAVLTIEPATVIKIAGPYLMVANDLNANGTGGTLNVNGNVDFPVIFTSWLDDSIAGDSNADGSASTPGPNDWGGIQFNIGSQGNLQDTRLQFSYTGLAVTGASPQVLGLQVSNSSHGILLSGTLDSPTSPTITDTTIDSTLYSAIYADATSGGVVSPTLQGVTVSNPSPSYAGVEGNGAGFTPTVTGLSVLGGGYGIVLNNGAAGSYTSTSIDGAQIAGLLLMNGSGPSLYDATNSIANVPVAYQLIGQTLPASLGAESHTGIAKPQLLPISGLFYGNQQLGADPLGTGSSVWQLNGSIQVTDNATLEITSGTVIKSADSGFTIEAAADSDASGTGGTLIISGTEPAPVILTSLYDDSVNGDSNADGSLTQPTQGQVRGLIWAAGSAGNLSFAEIRYADRGVTITGASPALSELAIREPNYGIYIEGAPSTSVNPLLNNVQVEGALSNSVLIDGSTGSVTPTFTGYNRLFNGSPEFCLVNVFGAGAIPSLSGMELTGGSYGIRVAVGAGGVYNTNVIRNSVLSGVLLETTGTVTLSRNVIVANQGTGIDLVDVGTASTISHNLVRHNQAGGVLLSETNGDNPLLANNLILENRAVMGGGIYLGASSSATLQGNTISGNTCSQTQCGGGIAIGSGANVTLQHNIVSFNQDAVNGVPEPGDDLLLGATPIESYNLTTDGTLSGTGSLTGDPLFEAPWYLSSTPVPSPGVDAGASNALPAYLTDLSAPTTSSTGAIDTQSGDLLDLGFHYDGTVRSVNPLLTSVTANPSVVAPGGTSLITLIPIDANLQLVGPGQRVELEPPTGGSYGAVVDRGDGSYVVPFTAPATGTGSTSVFAIVNGVFIETATTISW